MSTLQDNTSPELKIQRDKIVKEHFLVMKNNGRVDHTLSPFRMGQNKAEIWTVLKSYLDVYHFFDHEEDRWHSWDGATFMPDQLNALIKEAVREFVLLYEHAISYAREDALIDWWDAVEQMEDIRDPLAHGNAQNVETYSGRDIWNRLAEAYPSLREGEGIDVKGFTSNNPVWNHTKTKERENPGWGMPQSWAKTAAISNALSNNLSGYDQLLDMATTYCRITDEAKKDDNCLVFGNGYVDLRGFSNMDQMVLKPHDPSLYTRLKCDFNYRTVRERKLEDMGSWNDDEYHEFGGPGNEHYNGRWNKYIEMALPDVEVRRFLQGWIGRALFGQPEHKGFVNIIGPSNTGKSVLFQVMDKALGSYAKSVNVSVFLKTKHENRFALDQLRGSRVVMASEPPAGAHLDQSGIKTITGGDVQNSERKFHDSSEWKPRCTVFIASNHPIIIQASDDAILTRLYPIVFDQVFVGYQTEKWDEAAFHRGEIHKADENIAHDIMNSEYELSDFIDWALEGYCNVEKGLINLRKRPKASSRALEGIKEESSLPLRFIRDRINADHMGPDGEFVQGFYLSEQMNAFNKDCVLVSKLYAEFTSWAMCEGIESRWIPSKSEAKKIWSANFSEIKKNEKGQDVLTRVVERYKVPGIQMGSGWAVDDIGRLVSPQF